MTNLLAIGDLSHASGLPVSALRYYDAQGVLVPAVVDERTGYRRYAPEQVVAARFVGGLRSIRVPVAEMPPVLERLADREEVAGILAAHVAHLQDEVAAARRTVDELLTLLDSPVDVAELVFPAPAFRAALGQVAYAVGERQDDFALDGIHLIASGGICTWAATDRYRWATTTTPVSQGVWSATLPVAALRALLDDADDEVHLPTSTPGLPGRFPDAGDLRPYLGRGTTSLLSAAELRARLQPVDETLTEIDGTAVNRRYLDEAVAALGEEVLLELGNEVAPVALRHPQDGSTWSLLMPHRRDDTDRACPQEPSMTEDGAVSGRG